jgi:Fe2+ transport system protein FeoA
MVYEVIDVPQPINCENCNPCLRIRLMELGFITGQKIELGKKRLGLYSVNVLSDNGDVAQTIALREEELDRICLKELL